MNSTRQNVKERERERERERAWVSRTGMRDDEGG